jgi:hypothetical protein
LSDEWGFVRNDTGTQRVAIARVKGYAAHMAERLASPACVPITGKELARWQVSLARSRPFGEDAWIVATARRLGLQHTMRSEGGDQPRSKP